MSAFIQPDYRLLIDSPNEIRVLTNGCFDILHVGHIRLLQRASIFGGSLIVAVNSDASVRMLKGKERPAVPLEERMELLAALGCVSIVTSFPDNNVASVIRHLHPHCWVKGGDYTMESLNKSEVQAANDVGAAIIILPRIGKHSTSGIIERLKA